MMQKQIPNILTTVRIFLTLPIVMALLSQHHTLAFYLLIIAGLSDSIDGYLARHYKWGSWLGSMLDPLADKILMVSVFLALTYLSEMPLWLLTMVILREMILITGTVMLHLLVGPYKVKPILVSKLNTFLQILLTFIIIFNLSYGVIPYQWIHLLMLLVFATTTISMLAYIWIWSEKVLGRREI